VQAPVQAQAPVLAALFRSVFGQEAGLHHPLSSHRLWQE